MIKQAISRVVEGQDLAEADMIEVMSEIMRGEATPAQIAAFVVGLRLKGETVEEITGAARVMREYATPVRVVSATAGGEKTDFAAEQAGALLDTCGTGGSGIRSFNISTTVAFVVAACGVRVAKHGNRSVSSACGSADVLEALGVRLDAGVGTVERCIAEAGIGFLFAPSLHGAMRHAIGPRREIGIRTIFNILGPLTNPAGADRQLLGVYREDLVPTLADVLCRLGCRRGFVVCGLDGMDEITLTAPTRLADIRNGEYRLATVAPEDFGLRRCSLEDLAGGDARFNAGLVQAVLKGEAGPRRDIVLLNSAFALVAGGVASTVDDGLTAAAKAVDEGRAMQKLQALIRITGS